MWNIIMNSFVVTAHELAACIGRNAYESRADAVLHHLRKVFPISYKKYVSETGATTKDQRIAAAKSKLTFQEAHVLRTEIRDSVVSATQNVTDYKQDIGSGVQRCAEKINAISNLNAEEKKLVAEDCKRNVYTRFGTKNEAFVLAGIPNVRGDSAFRMKHLTDAYLPNGMQVHVQVGGKIDGYLQDAETGEKIIIEVKNRMNKLFGRIVPYERVQAMAYMYVHGAQRCKLIERFGSNILQHELCFDGDEWQCVVNEATRFANEVLALGYNYDPGVLFDNVRNKEDGDE